MISDVGVMLAVNCLRPHGRSGLKFDEFENIIVSIRSPPTRAEWIEIATR